MTSPKTYVDALLPKLRSDQVTYFPIRHHSPACAAHIARWIHEHRPRAVLIEGPQSFTAKLSLLTDPSCECPVAIYTNFLDRRQVSTDEAPRTNTDLEAPRFAAYYPLCDYSPELVAVRTGTAVGAEVRFIDLDYAEKILAQSDETVQPAGVRIESLADDPHLKHSRYITQLAQGLGCRDFNELWDHLFEAPADLSTDDLIDRLATYCALARLDYSDEDLKRDGTSAREACMAAAIREELERSDGAKGPVLVVTGGFHTVALPDLVVERVKRPASPRLADDQTGAWLVRYSFDQLDALGGYSAGMPSPGFYDRLWRSKDPKLVAADVLVEIGRQTRERQAPTQVSTPDSIAAVQMAQELALLRGHAAPLREDVLDAVRSCFVKGEMQGDGHAVMELVRSILAGDKVGRTPPECGVPPIVEDFRTTARQLRLPVDRVEEREMTLDLYRKTNHRRISRFFHCLDLLAAPFAQYQGGPDFVRGSGLQRIQEQWRVCWSPTTESALIDAAVYGPTVRDAAAAKLCARIGQLEEEGQSRCTAAAVELLVLACRLGLHQFSSRLVRLIQAHVAEDPDVTSVVRGLTQLELLAHSREPLEASHLTNLPALMTLAYQRSCRLMGNVATCPDEMVQPVVDAMRSLRETVCSEGRPDVDDDDRLMDADLFHDALLRTVASPPNQAQAAVVGAAAGVLFGEGVFSDAELSRVALGFLRGTAADARKTCGVLRGLFATAREIAWQVGELMQAVDEQFGAWDEETFLQSLPELRLAFADLTPRETTQVADGVAALHGQSTLGELVHMDVDESEMQYAVEINRVVCESLQQDGVITEPTGESA